MLVDSDLNKVKLECIESLDYHLEDRSSDTVIGCIHVCYRQAIPDTCKIIIQSQLTAAVGG